MTRHQTFGQRLRELRKDKNLSQRELAERVSARLRAEDRRGFDFTYLSKIENDRSPPPSIPAIVQLAHELGADPNELITLAGKPPPQMEKALMESEGARTFFRSAFSQHLTNAVWKKLAEDLERRKKKAP